MDDKPAMYKRDNKQSTRLVRTIVKRGVVVVVPDWNDEPGGVVGPLRDVE